MKHVVLIALVAACGGDDTAHHPLDAPWLECSATPPTSSCARIGPDFVPTGVNPSGPWSYGWSTQLGSSFTLYSLFIPGTDPSLDGIPLWADPTQIDGVGGGHVHRAGNVHGPLGRE